jgi:nicotinamidase-related amidase
MENEEVEIEICGVVTNMCVISNAVMCKAILPEAKITINAELCASFVDELHEQALNVMESMQMNIIGR